MGVLLDQALFVACRNRTGSTFLLFLPMPDTTTVPFSVVRMEPVVLVVAGATGAAGAEGAAEGAGAGAGAEAAVPVAARAAAFLAAATAASASAAEALTSGNTTFSSSSSSAMMCESLKSYHLPSAKF
jgi:hypothetical protein